MSPWRRSHTLGLPPLLPSAVAAGQPLLDDLLGRYVGTATAAGGEPVPDFGLGDPARGRLLLTREGVVVDRGPGSFLVAGTTVRDAHIGPDGELVLDWTHAGVALVTRFQPDQDELLEEWVRKLRLLLDHPAELPLRTPVTAPTAAPVAPEPTDPAPPGVPDELTETPARTFDPLTAPLDELMAEVSAPALVRRAPRPAVLVLEDGRAFHGEAYGAVGETVGEGVFNTGMTGYQETLTDPSYHRQVVVMTAPHIGNTGVNDEDPESSRIWVAGYVVRDPARRPSNWRAQRDLADDLAAQAVVGISGVDTRALTRHLRERGAMRVGISSLDADPAPLLEAVLRSPGMVGADLAREVSTPTGYVVPAQGERRLRVAALDLGIKASTPRYLAARGVEVHVLPATSSAAELLSVDPDGVFFSNGPGDPATADYAVAAMQGVLAAGRPVFGICFGNQVLGRALGRGTYKLKYGHRGVNQPVQERRTGRVHVTSHNHGFAVDAPTTEAFDSPFGRVEVSHVGLNDGVVEGLRCLDVPAFSVQYHPEAAPGPHDAVGLFDRFAELMGAR